MPQITAGQIVAFYLFDVAETIDLPAIASIVGSSAVPAKLAPKPATPAYVQYEKPPVSFDGAAVDVADLDGFQVRFRVYDYGVISIALSTGFCGDWSELLTIGQALIENAELEQRAENTCRQALTRLRPALVGLREALLSEDYLVYVVHALDRPLSADDLVASHGQTIAQMLRGERQGLSAQEQSAILQRRISYLADDLVIPTWNAAFVYDSEAGAAATLELFEFANSQLLEFRYHDAVLDAELARIYPQLQRTSWWNNLIGRGTARAANQLHSLFIDVNEITDRTENALKIVGDIYAARLLALVGARLGIARWKASVDEKLKTLDDIYRFAVEQVAISRGQFLELTVVLILILELILFMIGVMK